MSTNSAPTKLITQNTFDDLGGSHQRNPSWVVCIVSFTESAAAYSEEKTGTPKAKVLVIENDCLNVSINNNKSSFGKLASLSVKPTNFWYPGYVSAGDWMFIWMVDSQEKADYISSSLKTNLPGVGNKLCDETSGLKFAGRVLGVSTLDTVTNSSRTIIQTITGQAFLEFATSVYYTYAGQAAADTFNPNQLGGYPLPAALAIGGDEALLKFGQDSVLGKIAEKFQELYKTGKDHSPDLMIGLYYTFIMGVNSETSIINPELYNKPATGHHIIKVPKQVAQILGKPSATYLWELIDVNLGMHIYKNNGTNWWEKFQPEFDKAFQVETTNLIKSIEPNKKNNNIQKTPIATEGFIPYRPALWDNQSMWSIFEQYLNPVVNEMYTVLRINREGRIVPTFIVREKPFSNGIFNHLQSDGTVDENIFAKANAEVSSNQDSFGIQAPPISPLNPTPFDAPADPFAAKAAENEKNESAKKQIESAKKILVAANRTLYGTLPRWILNRTMIKQYGFSTSESKRVNYVQVWGSNAAPEYLTMQFSPQKFKQYQFNLGNTYHDNADITRNGLRSMILTSNCDIFLGNESGSFSNLWAKKNADWYFNGHLKANATVVLNGITAPICEGDNCQIGNIVYHIENVSHTGTISGGKKSFDTVLTLSNGMLAQSFETQESMKKVPLYPIHQGPSRNDMNGPGYTETQELTSTTGNNLDIAKGII